MNNPYSSSTADYESTEQERADFEAWGKTMSGWSGHKDEFGDYVCESEEFSWRAWQARAALQSQDREDASAAVDAAMESVRKQFCALPRYSFITRKGGVSRMHDSTGNWIEFDQAHALFDPVNVDHARRAEGGGE